MAFYAVHMLKIYLVVAAAEESPKFDMAEKFLNIFLAKAKELNRDVTNSDPGKYFNKYETDVILKNVHATSLINEYG